MKTERIWRRKGCVGYFGLYRATAYMTPQLYTADVSRRAGVVFWPRNPDQLISIGHALIRAADEWQRRRAAGKGKP